jgi:hypothetical protein
MEAAMTFHELQKIRVIELRQMAAKYGVEGTSAWKKEKLVHFLAEKLGIDRHQHGPLGLDKVAIKQHLHVLKADRDAALASHNHEQLKQIRRQMHRLKRQINKAIEHAH